MKISKRVIGLVLFVSVILLLGILFWPFILDKVIEPLSLAAWVLLRIFVLSIDQQYYWGAIIFVVSIFLFRLLSQNQIVVPSDAFVDSNATIRAIEYWRTLFIHTRQGAHDEETLRRELIRLLLSFYASKQRTSSNYLLYESMQKGDLPLPEHIYTFLFPEKPKKSKWALNRHIQSVREDLQKWMRRWTGQETAKHYQMINEVLSFMEKSMEMKNDDGKLNPNEH